jgi:aerobic-type carbon monoxide dehydrogenase small subunit (CoxS/CutS family)
MSVCELLEDNPNPDEEEIRAMLSGHLCRCTGYLNIVRAVQAGAERLRQLSR